MGTRLDGRPFGCGLTLKYREIPAPDPVEQLAAARTLRPTEGILRRCFHVLVTVCCILAAPIAIFLTAGGPLMAYVIMGTALLAVLMFFAIVVRS